jgi:hypothetical protein
MLISFFTPLSNLVNSIPGSVIGGVSIYLFGVIGAQGIAIMINRKVDLFDARSLAVISIILVVGIGGNYGFEGGMIPFFGTRLPAIASAALLGILANRFLDRSPETAGRLTSPPARSTLRHRLYNTAGSTTRLVPAVYPVQLERGPRSRAPPAPDGRAGGAKGSSRSAFRRNPAAEAPPDPANVRWRGGGPAGRPAAAHDKTGFAAQQRKSAAAGRWTKRSWPRTTRSTPPASSTAQAIW